MSDSDTSVRQLVHIWERCEDGLVFTAKHRKELEPYPHRYLGIAACSVIEGLRYFTVFPYWVTLSRGDVAFLEGMTVNEGET